NHVPEGTNTATAAPDDHSLALKSDGTLVGWGLNDFGQINVPGGTYTAIAAGPFHSLALKSDGTLVGWGRNDRGQINVPSGAYTAIAAGGYHNLALVENPSVPVTISSAPSGLSFTASGTGCEPGSYATPKTLNWSPGASCSVALSTPQSGSAGTGYEFTAWADVPTTASRTITAPVAATTYTATFTTQYLLTAQASPAGAGTVP